MSFPSFSTELILINAIFLIACHLSRTGKVPEKSGASGMPPVSTSHSGSSSSDSLSLRHKICVHSEVERKIVQCGHAPFEKAGETLFLLNKYNLRVITAIFRVQWGAGVRWTPLPKAEAPTEPTDETREAPCRGSGQSPDDYIRFLPSQYLHSSISPPACLNSFGRYVSVFVMQFGLQHLTL